MLKRNNFTPKHERISKNASIFAVEKQQLSYTKKSKVDTEADWHAFSC